MDLLNKNIIIAAGGTGGHIYPAIVVAKLLAENGANVIWIGTPNSMESKLIPTLFNIKYIKTVGVRGKNLINKLSFPFKLAISTFRAHIILKKISSDLVIGFGGYASGPTCLAAKLQKIPIIIHEQNAKIGFTNKILAKLANQICLAFDIKNLENYFNVKQLQKTQIVGNPLRKDIVDLNLKTRIFKNNHLKLLVLGGSQGAKTINNIIPKLILEVKKHNINIKVWHQTGSLLFEQAKKKYTKNLQENIKEISPFILNMPEAYAWADLVICRAGALTVSECAVAGLPAIFIPFPFAVDNHQFFNAQSILKNKAGFCLQQDKMTLENLIDIIKPLATDTNKLVKISANAKKTFIKNSSEQILQCVKKILTKQSKELKNEC